MCGTLGLPHKLMSVTIKPLNQGVGWSGKKTFHRTLCILEIMYVLRNGASLPGVSNGVGTFTSLKKIMRILEF